MMANELYLTLIYRPFPSKVVRAASRAESAQRTTSAEETEALRCIEDQSRMVQHSLIATIRTVGRLREKGIQYSSALEFSGRIWSMDFGQKVRRPAGPIYEYLQTRAAFFGSEMMELRARRTEPVRCNDRLQGLS